MYKCIEYWNDFEENLKRMKGWIDVFKKKIDDEVEGEKSKNEKMKRCRKIIEEDVNKKVVMEEMNDSCEVLMEMSE